MTVPGSRNASPRWAAVTDGTDRDRVGERETANGGDTPAAGIHQLQSRFGRASAAHAGVRRPAARRRRRRGDRPVQRRTTRGLAAVVRPTGKRPASEARATVAAAIEGFIEAHTVHLRSGDQTARLLRRHVTSRWGDQENRIEHIPTPIKGRDPVRRRHRGRLRSPLSAPHAAAGRPPARVGRAAPAARQASQMAGGGRGAGPCGAAAPQRPALGWCGVCTDRSPRLCRPERLLPLRNLSTYNLPPGGRARTPKPRSSGSHNTPSSSVSTERLVIFARIGNFPWQPPGRISAAIAGTRRNAYRLDFLALCTRRKRREGVVGYLVRTGSVVRFQSTATIYHLTVGPKQLHN